MNLERRSSIIVAGLATYAALSLISMATMSIGAGLLLACLLFAWGGPGALLGEIRSEIRENPLIRRYGILSLILAGACILSLISAELWPLGYGGQYEHVHFLKDAAKLWYFVWPLVLFAALKSCSNAQRVRVLKIWLGTFAVLSAIGVAQFFTGWPRPQPIPDGSGHFHATLFLGHHLSVASILIFPFFALLDLRLESRRAEIGRWVFLTLGFFTLIFTFSRMLWVALPVGILVWVLLRFQWRERLALLALLVVGAGVAYQIPEIKARLHHSMGIHEREDLWEANWQFYLARPVAGVGLRQNEDLAGYYLEQKYHSKDVFQGHAHNDVLDMLSMTGSVGTLAYLAWWIFLFFVLAREIQQNDSAEFFFGKGLMAAFVVYQINGLTQVNFWEGKVQHQLMWAVAWVLIWNSSRTSLSNRVEG